MEAIPDTSGYMIAGYVFAFVVMGIYVFSLYLRNSNLKRDAETLDSLQAEQSSSSKKK
ncbi:MAG: hypothetical protein HY863_14225 [Chloroflexi bacterium]|nr:hypothetical protein [Chloroflexota bacterium]